MKYIYNEILTNYFGKEQKTELKKVKPKLRKPGRMLVTRRYEPQAPTYQHQNNLSGKVLNMYDYFQEALDTPLVDVHVRLSEMFDMSKLKIVGIDGNRSDLYKNGMKIAEIHIAPLTVQLIGRVSWLNPVGEVTSEDIYDRRGFKSSTQYYHLDGSFGHQVLYNPEGEPKIEVIKMSHNGEAAITGYKLLNYEGADYIFPGEDDLWKFFKSELESRNEDK